MTLPRNASGVSSCFSADYAEARDRFLAQAQAAGFALDRHEHPTARGAQGESLTIDVATAGPATAPALLIVLSGTHGAEGFCGSGCQVALMRDAAFRAAAAPIRLVFVHALNPYGFSHLSRTNEDNVDLNRNFLEFSSPPAASAAYAGVHGFIVPDEWPPGPENVQRVKDYIAAHGMAALQAAVSGGQHEFPDGLFYGGVRPAWSNAVLRGVLREEGRSRQVIAWIDVHTGLGPRGHGERIYAGRADAVELARARDWWGDAVTSFHDGSSTSAPLTGVNFQAVYDECPQAQCAGIALEFGTLPMMDVLQALRADQWLANHPDASKETRATIKRMVRDAFYQDADDWKVQVLQQGQASARDALAGLTAKAGAVR